MRHCKFTRWISLGLNISKIKMNNNITNNTISLLTSIIHAIIHLDAHVCPWIGSRFSQHSEEIQQCGKQIFSARYIRNQRVNRRHCTVCCATPQQTTTTRRWRRHNDRSAAAPCIEPQVGRGAEKRNFEKHNTNRKGGHIERKETKNTSGTPYDGWLFPWLLSGLCHHRLWSSDRRLRCFFPLDDSDNYRDTYWFTGLRLRFLFRYLMDL